LCHKNNLSMGPVFSIKLTWLTWIWLRIWVLSQDETIITVVWPLCQTEQNHKILQFVLCQINIFCHQLMQNAMTEFVRYTKIYTNCSEIQNLRKSDKSIVIFWVNWWQKQLFPLKRQLFFTKDQFESIQFFVFLSLVLPKSDTTQWLLSQQDSWLKFESRSESVSLIEKSYI
jgi:hypothetical protein